LNEVLFKKKLAKALNFAQNIPNADGFFNYFLTF